MDPASAVELAALVERGSLWEDGELGRHEQHLRTAPVGEAAGPTLARAFRALALRQHVGPIPDRLRREIEGVFYPRLWKVLEAVREGLPPDEQLTRVEVLNRRLARLLADEERTA